MPISSPTSTTLPRIDQLPRLSPEQSFSPQPYTPGKSYLRCAQVIDRPQKRKADEISDSIDTTSGTKSATNVPSSQSEPALTKSPVSDKALPEDSPLRTNLTPVANTLRAKVLADLVETAETTRLAVEESQKSFTEANLARERAEKANEEREAERLLAIERAKKIVEGPARKKVKFDESIVERRNGGSMGKKIVSYAATALAGATVGALGAVVGLASLPPDYFA